MQRFQRLQQRLFVVVRYRFERDAQTRSRACVGDDAELCAAGFVEALAQRDGGARRSQARHPGAPTPP